MARDKFFEERVESLRLIDKERMAGFAEDLDLRRRPVLLEIGGLLLVLRRNDVEKRFVESASDAAPVGAIVRIVQERQAVLERQAFCAAGELGDLFFATWPGEYGMDEIVQGLVAIRPQAFLESSARAGSRVFSHRAVHQHESGELGGADHHQVLQRFDAAQGPADEYQDRKSTRLNSSH